MKLNKREFDASLFFDTSVLRESPLPSRDSQKILIRMLPRQLPGWGIEWRSSHKIHDTLKHLVLKGLWEDLNKREKQILMVLSTGVNEYWFTLIKQLLQLIESERTDLKYFYAIALQEEQISLLEPHLRFLRSFEPQIRVIKFWVEPTKVPPKRYIGKGHNDQGSLGSALSWKEMMSSDEGELVESEITRLNLLWLRFQEAEPKLSRLRIPPKRR